MGSEDDSIFAADKMILLITNRSKNWLSSKSPNGDWMLTDALALRGNFTKTFGTLPIYYDTKNGFKGIMSESDGKEADATTDHPLVQLKSNTVITAEDVITNTAYPKIVLRINANPESERQTCQAQKALGLRMGSHKNLVSLVGEELLAPVTHTEDGDQKSYKEWNLHELFDVIEKEAMLQTYKSIQSMTVAILQYEFDWSLNCAVNAKRMNALIAHLKLLSIEITMSQQVLVLMTNIEYAATQTWGTKIFRVSLCLPTITNIVRRPRP